MDVDVVDAEMPVFSWGLFGAQGKNVPPRKSRLGEFPSKIVVYIGFFMWSFGG